MIRIAIDCMSGDHGLSVVIPAIIKVAQQYPDVVFLAVGDTAQIQQSLQTHSNQLGDRLQIVHASEVVLMDDTIETALRRKKDSSMRVAINAVKEQQAHACISAGNTGALMAVARYVLKTMDCIDRPAIATALPNKHGGKTYMLDLGANVDCTAEHLLQFGLMGAAMVTAVDEIARPKVGLLNVGTEAIKGNDIVKQANTLLADSGLNFVGNVEGDDIFSDRADVIVCDGFTGNAILKSIEGLSKMISATIRTEFNHTWLTRLMGLCSLKVMRNIRRRLDNRRYNGALFLGLNGIVVKSHGSADEISFTFAIRHAIEAARHQLLTQVNTVIEQMHQLHQVHQDSTLLSQTTADQ